ncbi:hypothetical protein MSSAC_0703 [Methanosarcina siciliae C2J]|uniref:Uncharacterized protein n=1 Tax=Methanosarcina siciliae C2J TaxID=1434118 RepID=A0A0E3PJY0_9EURY|nr:hypothetical protein [Methanosarcina siciliae]AKB35293.1 hypothetical protein MSSAC_0703 [Methanosarcina siciliae C2J]
MVQNAEEIQTKNVNGKNKTYSIEFFQGAGAIICTYKGEKRNRENLNQVPYIERYGGKAVQIIGCLSLVLGIAILVGTVRIMNYLAELNFEESIYTSVFLTGLYPGIKICSIGNSLLWKAGYVKATRCKRCHRNYAYEEREEPDVKEISTEDSYAVTVTRHWRCKYCGHIDNSKSPEKIKAYKGLKEMKKVTGEVKCEKCGRTEFNFEYRNPDVKEDPFGTTVVETTTKYYKCNYCGNLNITEEETVYETTPWDFL